MSEYKKLSDGVFPGPVAGAEIGIVETVRVSVIDRIDNPLAMGSMFHNPYLHEYSYEVVYPGHEAAKLRDATAKSTLLIPGQRTVVLDGYGKKLIIENRNGEAMLKEKQSWLSRLLGGEQPLRRIPISS